MHKQIAITQHISYPGGFLASVKATSQKQTCFQNKSDLLKLNIFNKTTSEHTAISIVLDGLVRWTSKAFFFLLRITSNCFYFIYLKL